VAPGLRLKHARQVDDVTAALSLDPQADRQAVLWITVEDVNSDARQRLTRQHAQALRELLRRQVRKVFEDASHGSVPVAKRRSRRSLNHGRSEIRAGAKWP
jgi:hypothetical protein